MRRPLASTKSGTGSFFEREHDWIEGRPAELAGPMEFGGFALALCPEREIAVHFVQEGAAAARQEIVAGRVLDRVRGDQDDGVAGSLVNSRSFSANLSACMLSFSSREAAGGQEGGAGVDRDGCGTADGLDLGADMIGPIVDVEAAFDEPEQAVSTRSSCMRSAMRIMRHLMSSAFSAAK